VDYYPAPSGFHALQIEMPKSGLRVMKSEADDGQGALRCMDLLVCNALLYILRDEKI